MSKAYKSLLIIYGILVLAWICVFILVITKKEPEKYPQFEVAKGYIVEDLDDKYDVYTIYGYDKIYLAEDKYIVRVYFQTSQSTIEREYIVIIKDEIKIYLVDFRD
jgi:hypothetical protein